nr:uncharacterized protein LOC113396159 [Vanessa tameamea]
MPTYKIQGQIYHQVGSLLPYPDADHQLLPAPGGTGKTFVISLILETFRSEQKIALALASSGIAATLLEGGRTARSALKLPLNVQMIETPICNISRNSAMAKVLRLTSIILWNECTMANKKSLEAFNRTMQDIRGNHLFGGALILLSGDFRQTLPIIPRSTPADEINACLKSSVLWRYVQKLTLNINMRINLQNDPAAHDFSKQLFKAIETCKQISYNIDCYQRYDFPE